MSNSLWPHGLQHARLLCPPLSLGVCSNSCPLSQWCYLTISSSIIPFFSCPQSFPASRSLPVSRLFASDAKVLELQLHNSPSNEYWELISFKIDWFYLLAVQGTIKIFTASSPVAYLTSFNLGDSSSSIVSFCFVIMSTRFSRQEYWSGLPFPPPVDPVLSELFTVICQSWVTLHSMAHGFIELCKTLCSNKAVILEGDYNFRL